MSVKGLIRYILAYGTIKLYKGKYRNAIIFVDGLSHAQDNAEVFIAYCKKQNLEKIYYLIDEKSADYARLKKMGIPLIKSNSLAHMVVSLKYKYIFTSYYNAKFYSFFYEKELDKLQKYIKGEMIFLEHGITYNDQSKVGVTVENPRVRIKDYICSADGEYEAIKNIGGFKYVKTGLPRHDLLVRNSKNENKIMIFFTWRQFLNVKEVKDENIISHFTKINDFLKLDIFKKLHEENNTIINLFLHKAYYKNAKYIDLPSHINLCTFQTSNIMDEIATSKLLITDYSSVQFEFFFQDKQVINYQFDREQFYSGHYFPLIDIDKVGLTNPTYTINEFNYAMDKVVEHDFKITNEQKIKYDEFFGFRDDKNSKRLFEYYFGKEAHE